MREIPVIENLALDKPQTFGNVAALVSEDRRRMFATDLIELVRIDETSMSGFTRDAERFLDRMTREAAEETRTQESRGTGEEAPPSTEMTLTACVQFVARAVDALLGEPDLIKASEDDPAAADLAKWISSQFRTTDRNWVPDTDPLIAHMGATGLAWRKRDFDDIDKAFHSTWIPSCGRNRVIINAKVRSASRAPRITHEFQKYPYEIQRAIERKHWIDYDPRFDDASDPQAEKNFFEMDAWVDLDGDGIEEPWTFTISADDTPDIVRIRPRWSGKTLVDTKDELTFKQIIRFYPYMMLPDPNGGFFPLGFGKLLERVESSADTILGNIVDTTKTESQNGGIYAGGGPGGIGMPKQIEVANDRINVLNTDGAPLGDRLQMLQTKTVSQGSVAVLEKIMALGDRLAGTLNLLENAPSSMTATMAKGIIDTGSKLSSATHRRACTAITEEAKEFAAMADAYGALPDNLQASSANGIAVTADPALATEMQRAAQGSMYFEMAKEPIVFNAQECALRFAQTMRFPNPEKLVAQPQPPQLTPDEKAKTIIGLMKHRNDSIKANADVAVKMSQSLLNLAQAGGALQDMRMVQLQMAQLEQIVQQMAQDSNSASNFLDGLSQQPDGSGASQLGAPPQGPNDSGVSGGDGSNSAGSGQGSGV